MSKEDANYARFGRDVADLLARTDEWDADTLSRISELAQAHSIDLSWPGGDD